MIVEHMFSDRIVNWGRVVALCVYVRTVSITLVNRGLADRSHVEETARALAEHLVSRDADLTTNGAWVRDGTLCCSAERRVMFTPYTLFSPTEHLSGDVVV